MLKITSRKSLSLCLVAALAVTIATFSQETAPAPAPVAEVLPMTLPADNVELTDVNGRTITVTVLSKDATGIVIRTADGKEIHVLLSKLNAATVEKLVGRKEAPKERLTLEQHAQRVLALKEQEILERAKTVRKERDALKGIPTKEIVKLLQEQSPKLSAITETDKQLWAKKISLQSKTKLPDWSHAGLNARAGDPNWEKYNFNLLHILSKIEVKDHLEEEKVSLRPTFEKLGVKAREQEKHMCWIYSAQHLAQYVFLSKGQTPPTITNLKGRLSTRGNNPNNHMGGNPQSVIGPINETIPNQRLNVLWFETRADGMNHEMVKHQLRNNRACIGTMIERIGSRSGRHSVVIVGFHTKDGITTWEILNSNNVANDQGYKIVDHRAELGGVFSFWLK